MWLKEIILEGFKSYATRTVVSGFDKEFNAITGLNGSGKSNILDSICFVLGISNLSQVRCSSLQELVYKQGQGGVNKATVTLVFDNTDTAGSPVGYEDYDEITVTRQIVIGGRNKYLINGHNAQQSRVQNLFHSVQLNVNNPHFLIMQGRITKVLNMKPPEILAMIEEAAGTRMFEMKKQSAEKTLDKKELKVEEIRKVLAEEITPTLEKLRKDKASYQQWSANTIEIEHLARFCVAYDYTKQKELLEKGEEKKAAHAADLEACIDKEADLNREVADFEKEIEDELRAKESAMDGEYQQMEKNVSDHSKELVQLNAVYEHKKEAEATERKTLKALEKTKVEAEEAIVSKTDEITQIESESAAARDTFDTLKAEYTQAQQDYEMMSTGVSSGDGETLADKLMEAKKAVTAAASEAKQAQVKVDFSEKAAKEMAKEAKAAEKACTSLKSGHAKAVKAVAACEKKIDAIDFSPEKLASLKAQKITEEAKLEASREKVDALSAQLARLDFQYSAPTKNFDHSKVKGLVAQLIKVNDPATTTAIEVTAGGKLYQVVVDNEVTGKALLDKGQLRRRVTIIPLNKINNKTVASAKVKTAEKAVGKDNVTVALKLVGYDSEVQAAMNYVFGNTLICPDSDSAKTVAFHKEIRTKAVTYEGDVFDPAGTLTGGSRAPGSSVLTRLQALNDAREVFNAAKATLDEIVADIQSLETQQTKYSKLEQDLAILKHEVELAETKMAQDLSYQVIAKYESLAEDVKNGKAAVKDCKVQEKAANDRVKETEKQMKSLSTNRDKQLKQSKAAVDKAKKALDNATASVKESGVQVETRNLEIVELKNEISSIEKQIEVTLVAIEVAEEAVAVAGTEAGDKKREYETAKQIFEDEKKKLAAADKKVSKLTKQRDAVTKKLTDIAVEKKQMEHAVARIETEHKNAEQSVMLLLDQYPWIESEKQFFGQPGTAFDFKNKKPEKAKRDYNRLKEEQNRLGKSINKKVMSMFEKAEGEYQELMEKKRIIENDKSKIQDVIRELEQKKNEALEATWKKVNKDFGSIFSTLLPGTTAKLDRVHAEGDVTILAGLEIKVAFGGEKFKESLTELSGGQRSLLALSLILSLLLFKPAPMYILDEIDAALDLSHTQNIGQMLKAHFSQSQFIVVSLKEGMFNNANVLFKTKFVDGVSTVTRTVPQKESKENADPKQKKKGRVVAKRHPAAPKRGLHA